MDKDEGKKVVRRWTLVNKQGEVEGSDIDTSSSDSLEVLGLEAGVVPDDQLDDPELLQVDPGDLSSLEEGLDAPELSTADSGQLHGTQNTPNEEDTSSIDSIEELPATSQFQNDQGATSDEYEQVQQGDIPPRSQLLDEQECHQVKVTDSTSSSEISTLGITSLTNSGSEFEKLAQDSDEGIQEEFSSPLLPSVQPHETNTDSAQMVLPPIGEHHDHTIKPPFSDNQADDKDFLHVSEEFDHSPQSSDQESPRNKSKISRPKRRLHDPIFNRLTRNKRESDSESTDSDFVRLETNMVEEVPRPSSRMQASASSTASSLSQGFFFFRRGYRREDEDDVVPGDVDDRVESDISGIAADDDDLSSSSSIGDLPISAGDVHRSYQHKPNASLNDCLTYVAVVTLCLAVGVGVGHFLGTKWEPFEGQMDLEILYKRLEGCERSSRLLHVQLKHSEDELQDILLEQQHQSFEKDSSQHAKDLHIARLLHESLELKKDKEKLSLELASLHYNFDELEVKYKEEKADQIEITVQLQEAIDSNSQLLTQQQEQTVLLRDRNEALQTAIMELKSEKQQLQSTTAQLTQDKERLSQDIQELTTKSSPLTETIIKQQSRITELTSQKEAVEWTNQQLLQRVNHLATENSDLKNEVGKTRYAISSSDGMPSADDWNQLKDMATQLNTENQELKSQTVSLTNSLTSCNNAKVEAESRLKQMELEMDQLQNQLNIEKNRGTMYENLYLSIKKNQEKDQEAFNVTFFNCMNVLASSVKLNMSQLVKSANLTILNEASLVFSEYQNLVQNLTKDSNLSEYMQTLWDDFKQNVESTDVTGYFEKMRLVFDQLQDSIKNQWNDFSGEKGEKSAEGSGDSKKQHSLSKTIGKTVTKAMSKVKEFSKKVLKEHKQAIKSIKDSVKQLKHEIHQKWNKISGNDVKNVPVEKDANLQKEAVEVLNEDVVFDEYEPNIQKWIHQYENENPKEFGPKHWAAVFSDLEESPTHDKKVDRIHKDTQQELGLDPEELLHDSFFEGNHRQWKKYQKTFKKIIGRIQKLNEDSLVTLDDDDIEDLYDDLDDLLDDVEDKEISDKLKTWLTCQVRWWKSRFHRKHRDQDLMKGCGGELMRWQLRVFCNEACGKRGCHAKDSSWCQSLWQKTQAKSGDKNKKQCQSDKKFKGARSEPQKTHFKHTQYWFHEFNTTTFDNAAWYFQRAQDRDNHLADAAWWFKRKNARYHMIKFNQDDPEWYFSRVHDREYHHHPTNWMFKRASDRNQQRHNWVRSHGGRQRRHG